MRIVVLAIEQTVRRHRSPFIPVHDDKCYNGSKYIEEVGRGMPGPIERRGFSMWLGDILAQGSPEQVHIELTQYPSQWKELLYFKDEEDMGTINGPLGI
jgi:hypothetical protein